MQRLLEIPQEVYDFLRNFRLRAGDLNRDSPGCLLLPLRGNSPCGGSKTAPFTHPLPGVHAPLAGISILQQTQFTHHRRLLQPYTKWKRPSGITAKNTGPIIDTLKILIGIRLLA